jgi:hypothetical protein
MVPLRGVEPRSPAYKAGASPQMLRRHGAASVNRTQVPALRGRWSATDVKQYENLQIDEQSAEQPFGGGRTIARPIIMDDHDAKHPDGANHRGEPSRPKA